MTTEEKLKRAIEFIKKVENIDFNCLDVEDLVSIKGECAECGSCDIDIESRGDCMVVDPRDIDNLKDEAWHVLVDIDAV